MKDKIIDPKNVARYSYYQYFSSFENPCYGFDVEMDITDIYELSKYRKESIFINLLYLITISLNRIDEMRIRVVNNKLVLHELINPSYMVMTDLGIAETCGHKMTYDYEEFYKLAEEQIEAHRHANSVIAKFNASPSLDDFYISCLPWLNFSSMIHPIPTHDKGSMSVPRICWGKFYHRHGKTYMMLNITVSHALIDGKQLSDAFNLIQDSFDHCHQLCTRNEFR